MKSKDLNTLDEAHEESSKPHSVIWVVDTLSFCAMPSQQDNQQQKELKEHMLQKIPDPVNTE